MNQERSLDVTETRFGLTFVICLLVMLGYMILHYLGGASHAPTVEIRPGIVAEPESAPATPVPLVEEQPQVLTIESSGVPEHAQHTSPVDSSLR